MTAEEKRAIMDILSSVGLRESFSKNVMETSLSRLMNPSPEAKKSIRKLGVKVADSDGNFIGIVRLIGQLERGFRGLTEKERQSSLATIFGAEAVQVFNILLRKVSKELGQDAL